MIDENKVKEHNFESNLEKIQTRVLQSMGPLTKVWHVLESANMSSEDKKAIPLEKLITGVEKSILLVKGMGRKENFQKGPRSQPRTGRGSMV